MIYFSGFCLQDESELFEFWLEKNEYCVAGFSYGAIKALEYALNSESRIDRLILLSPAFFNDKDSNYIELQLHFFKKNRELYKRKFLENASDGYDLSSYIIDSSYEDLEKLLTYEWSIDNILNIVNNGTIVEVILGENDKIINSKNALEFFKDITTTHYIKNANHILKGS